MVARGYTGNVRTLVAAGSVPLDVGRGRRVRRRRDRRVLGVDRVLGR